MTGASVSAARHAARVTLAACAGFYVFRYGLDAPIAATYALLAVVVMGGLPCILPGTGRQRASVSARLLPLVWVLVAAGTFSAVHPWTAVAGTLVTGFAVAFVAVAGPSAAGATPGLQLLYILPCFPPYAPDTLGQRLAGVTIGIVLLALAEAFLLPEYRPRTYADTTAHAARIAARCAAELGQPPFHLGPGNVRAANVAAEALRPSQLTAGERPAGPGVHDRALTQAGISARTLLEQLVALSGHADGPPAAPDGADLLHAIGRRAARTAALFRGKTPARETVDALQRARAEAEGECPADAASMSRRALLLDAADTAQCLYAAVEIAVGDRSAAAQDPTRFWYADHSALRLWWHRIARHTGPRSVYFQNAVRIGLALAAARTVASLGTPVQGFWAVLAVLSLTCTRAVRTRSTARGDLIGTMLGALTAAILLWLIGDHPDVYAMALPPLLLTAFTVSPLRGAGWAQALFILVVSFAVAQAPAHWEPAGFRLLDVLVGSCIGILFGMPARPRCVQEDLKHSVGVMLEACADTVATTITAIVAGRLPERTNTAQGSGLGRGLGLAESAFAQYQMEEGRVHEPARDWHAALVMGHYTLWGSRRLLQHSKEAGRSHDVPLGSRPASLIDQYGREVVSALRTAAAHDPLDPSALADRRTMDGAPPRFYAAMVWLDALTTDVERFVASRRSSHWPMSPPSKTGRTGADPSGASHS